MRGIALVVVLTVASLAVRADAVSAGELRLEHLQVVGTHNSYHQEASPAEQRVLDRAGVPGREALEYAFPPLARQLARHDVRQLELDVFADPEGGRYATPALRRLAGGGPHDLLMHAPGIKVLHIQDYDYRSSCFTLVACLTEIESWSASHPGHVPLTVLLELKDQPLPRGIRGTDPLPWTAVELDSLDAEIRSVFSPRQLIVPDDVRAGRLTLSSAVLAHRWPTLATSRGKVMLLMNDSGRRHRDAYLTGHPGLTGRVLFTTGRPGRPETAFVQVDDPRGRALKRIRRLARRGYLVRTRADADTREARTGDTRRRDAALRSGAHWVSTDYPARGMAARFGSSYAVSLGRPARCNPVTAPSRCRSARLERQRRPGSLSEAGGAGTRRVPAPARPPGR